MRMQIETDAKRVSGTITAVFDQYATQLRITARSKQLWSEVIDELRNAVSTLKTALRHRVGTRQEVRRMQKDLHKPIKKETREM